MRLVDADAIEYTHAIARSLDDGHNWNELCVTKDEIEDMPTIQPEPHWTPCNKELPTKSDTYLVSANDKSVFDLYYSVEHGWDGWWNGRISAWMPLPEPMRMEKQ